MGISETSIYQACVSEESVVSMGGGVVYASPDGLVMVSSNGAQVVTRGVFTEREWQRLNPETIRAAQWQGIYVASFDGEDGVGAFMFDPSNPEVGVIWLDLPRVSAIYQHPESDRLYMVDDGTSQIVEWDADSNTAFATFKWRSAPVNVFIRQPMNVVQVFADSYPATVRLYADGSEQVSTSVSDDRPHRVSGGQRAREYAVEVEGDVTVYNVAAATSVTELMQQ
jgi:hypothetical protein